MNKLTVEKRKQIVRALVEGNSIRSTCRITGAAKGTVLKLLKDIGEVCAEYQYEHLRNLKCKKIQCDEIWSFCYAKKKNVPEDKQDEYGYGDVWTFTAICADSKLVPAWYVGNREAEDAKVFMLDVASRMATRVQLTTDGHKAYFDAVPEAFNGEVDYSILLKLYNKDMKDKTRYSSFKCTGIKKVKKLGEPKDDAVSTSFVERQNLNMRMSMRRFTRLTNAFSKKVDNLAHAVALHFMYYNYCRIHKTLGVSPAMEAGVTDHLWELEEVIGLLESKENSN